MFNVPGASAWFPAGLYNWYPIGDDNLKKANPDGVIVPDDFDPKFFPRALKFTFTLYDSKGIIKGGREFTHIVYIGD